MELARLFGRDRVDLDESDGELDSFVQARKRGYAGISSKTCKGIYKSLLNAARCAAESAIAQAEWRAGAAITAIARTRSGSISASSSALA